MVDDAPPDVRVIPLGASVSMWTEWRWRHVRTGADQTALVPQENVTDWTRVKRRCGRWQGPWETVDE